jgi:8-oxo-dGTP pyrophosphatase MutT (NUDIX family)
MEIWDVLDKNGQPTGKTVERKRVCLARGEYHLVVHIWILGSDGRVLIQRRSFQKPLMAGEWAAIGGSAVSGESPAAAAKRELFEEMGIDSKEEDLKLIRIMCRKNSILNIFLISRDTSLSELILQESEVSDAKWVHRNKLRQMIKNGEFHNYGKEYFDTVFAAFDKKSALRRRRKRYERRHKK